jgi:hypothetical protein
MRHSVYYRLGWYLLSLIILLASTGCGANTALLSNTHLEVLKFVRRQLHPIQRYF